MERPSGSGAGEASPGPPSGGTRAADVAERGRRGAGTTSKWPRQRRGASARRRRWPPAAPRAGTAPRAPSRPRCCRRPGRSSWTARRLSGASQRGRVKRGVGGHRAVSCLTAPSLRRPVHMDIWPYGQGGSYGWTLKATDAQIFGEGGPSSLVFLPRGPGHLDRGHHMGGP